MSRFPARRLAAVALVLVATLGLGTAATALGATDRIPVSSTDNTSLSIVNRIGAVDNVVVAMDGRLERILAAVSPEHPPAPIFETRSSLGTLIGTIDAQLCNTDGVLGTGDASLADGDVFASDVSATGLANQLSSVSRVLVEANGRLVRILGSHPPSPIAPEVQSALGAVRGDAAAGFEAISGRIGDGVHPPSPCFSA
jgi:hypothetical protein